MIRWLLGLFRKRLPAPDRTAVRSNWWGSYDRTRYR